MPVLVKTQPWFDVRGFSSTQCSCVEISVYAHLGLCHPPPRNVLVLEKQLEARYSEQMCMQLYKTSPFFRCRDDGKKSTGGNLVYPLLRAHFENLVKKTTRIGHF